MSRLVTFCFAAAIFVPFLSNAQNTQVYITGPELLCAGQCGTYKAEFTSIPGANALYEWNVSGSVAVVDTFTGNPITVCFDNPGTYTITVLVKSQNGQIIGQASYTVHVVYFIPVHIVALNPVICDSTAAGGGLQNNCSKVCPYSTVTYTLGASDPTGTSSQVSWSVSGAQSYTIDSFTNTVTVTWGPPGSGSISATTNTGFCVGEDGECVTIIQEPVAQFATNPLPAPADTVRICRGQTVWFQNQSLYADSYEWFFGDGSAPVSTVHPQYSYNVPGVYTVTLIALSACLCADTTFLTVEVLNSDAPLLDCVGTVCPGTTVTYTTGSTCTSFNWSVGPTGVLLGGGGPGDNTITVQWNSGPSGSISLLAQNCSAAACPIPAVTQIPVIDDNAEINGPERVCPDAETVYSIEPYQGTGFVWALSGGGFIQEGQGTNRIVVHWNSFPNPGVTYWLSVKYDNCYLGCGGQDSIGVHILSPFVINGPVELCENASGNFTAKLTYNGSNMNANWTVFDPSGNAYSNSTGVSMSPAFNQGSGIYRLYATPVNPLQTCTDQADWALSTLAIPAGPTGISGNGNFCNGNTMTYEAEGVPANANLQWTVQNGSGAPAIMYGNPVNVTWGAAGPWGLSVVQLSDDGLNCSSTPVSLNIQPVGPASVTILGGDTICINGNGSLQATGVEGLDVSWSLPTGGGSITSGQNSASIDVFWNAAGNQQVNLLVCGQTITHQVAVMPTPAPAVTAPAALCAGTTDIVSTAAPFTVYSWQYANGVELGNMPTVTLGPGSYVLEVTDANGCEGITPFSINTSPKPNISISTSDPTGSCNNSQTVTMQALVSGGGNYTYLWYKDGISLGVTTPVYSTNQYGSYTLVATNSSGCTATAGPILIFSDCGSGGGAGFPGPPGPACPPGAVDILTTPSAACDSFTFNVINGGSYLAGSASWFFGQSGSGQVGSGTGDQFGFLYPNAGKYITVLIAQLTTGAFCKVVDSLDVEAVAQFDTLPGCAGSATQFTDISTWLPNSAVVDYDWNFGDPASGGANTANTANAAHTFATGGVYNVSLTITAISGCTSEQTLPLSISDGTPVPFNLPTASCINTSLPFEVSPPPGILALDWDFGDPASGSLNTASGDTVFHTFGPGTFTVSLSSTDQMGCTAVSMQMLTTAANSLSGNITPAAPGAVCEGQSVTLVGPAGGITYLWSDSTTTTSNFTIGSAGVYDVTLTDANGCTYAPPPVTVNILPEPNVTIKAALVNGIGQLVGYSYPSLSVCAGEDVHLITQSAGTYTYSWSQGSTSNELDFSAGHNNQLVIGTHVYTVTVTDVTTGCTAVSDPFVVEVHPVPSGFSIALNNAPACAGNANILTYTGPQPPNWQLVWNTGATGPVLNTEEPGVYFLRVVNEFGCAASSNPLTILPGPNVQALPSGCHTRCKPDSLCLPNIPGIVSWQWYQDNIPVPGATNPNFVAQQSGTYWAELTDIYGCVNQSGPLVLDLYDGFGTILGEVWSDINNNGLIDAGDTLVSNIDVQLLVNGVQGGIAQSGAAGNFAFSNILSANYAVSIDTALLPAQWEIVIGQDSAFLSGCDVLDQVGLLLHYNCQLTATQLALSACQGDSVFYNNSWLQAGSAQSFVLTTALGCDSTVTVTVNAIPPATSAVSVAVCPGGVYNYNGFNIPEGQTQQVTLMSAAGCDSIVTVSVGALPLSYGAVNAAVCPGDVYNYNGTSVNPGQSLQFYLTNYQGCDSIVTVTVGTLPVSSGAFNTAVCPGAVYNYNGTNIPAGSSQQFTLTNYLGCDSILTVTVGTLPVSTGLLNVAACPGGVYNYNGTDIPVGSSQQFTLTNYLGCDSILTVTVGTLPVSTGLLNVAACPGGVYNYNGTDILVGSSQQFTLTNYQGCDSILTVTVGTLPVSAGLVNAAVCPGGVYNYNGTDIPVGSSQQFTLTNYLGCDSVVTVTVGTLPVSSGVLNASVCPGTDFIYNGTAIAAGQSMQFVLTNYAGCDSVLTVSVNALPVYSAVLEVSTCPGVAYNFNGVDLQAGTEQIFHFTTSEGCDSAITVRVLSFPALDFGIGTLLSCPGAATGSVAVVNLSGGQQPFEYALDGLSFQPDSVFTNLAEGNYTVTVRDGNGCLFLKDAPLSSSPPLVVDLADAVLPCELDSIFLQPSISGDVAGLQILWSNGAQSPSIFVSDIGPVWVEASNHCETIRSEAVVSWADLPDQQLVYVPNVFAPAAQLPENDHFRSYFADNVEVLSYVMRIYDRWGNFMFETKVIEDGWTGPFRGDDMEPGVYVWYLDAKVRLCRREKILQLKGDITILR